MNEGRIIRLPLYFKWTHLFSCWMLMHSSIETNTGKAVPGKKKSPTKTVPWPPRQARVCTACSSVVESPRIDWIGKVWYTGKTEGCQHSSCVSLQQARLRTFAASRGILAQRGAILTDFRLLVQLGAEIRNCIKMALLAQLLHPWHGHQRAVWEFVLHTWKKEKHKTEWATSFNHPPCTQEVTSLYRPQTVTAVVPTIV